MFSLNNKVAVVTGGASGIGLAVVQRFLAAGAKVIAADITNTDELAATEAAFVQIDVSSESAVADGFRAIRDKFGLWQILVNNAGIALDEGGIEATDTDVFRRVLDVNLLGVLHGLKHGPRYMSDAGSIINTASLAAISAIPQYTAYAASKAAVLSLTRQSALELAGRGIRVNAVCPGTTLTPMEPGDSEESQLCAYLSAAGRPGTTREQAAVFHFLASDDSSYVNAQAINVDGGWVHGVTNAAKDRLIHGVGQK